MSINKNIRLLLYGSNLWYFGEGMLGPLFAIFSEQMGGDVFDISLAWATYLFVSGVLFIVVGRVTDVYDNKEKIMVLGYALNTLFTFAYLLVSTQWHLFVVQAGLGVACALATPTWNALYAKHEDRRNSGLQWGLADGTSDIVIGIALVIGGFIVSYSSFQVLFVIMGCIQLVATFYQAKILKKQMK